MPIDPEKLLRFEIPKVREQIRPREAALYALSVGMGRDPLDRHKLPFVDPLAGPRIMPSMVLVMAHPGFWMGDPQSGVDPGAVLHVAQSFEIYAPLRAGMQVNSASRISGLKDKGPGKPALIDTETELTGENGALLARLNRTTFVRNGGGFGGEAPNKSDEAVTPIQPPDMVVDLKTGSEQALLYRLNGDYNPLHSDPDTAAMSGFDRPILHGLCTMGIITHALLQSLTAYEADRIPAMSLRFRAPMFPGETIRTEIWRDGAFQARALERDIVVADQGAFTLTPLGITREWSRSRERLT